MPDAALVRGSIPMLCNALKSKQIICAICTGLHLISISARAILFAVLKTDEQIEQDRL